MDPIDLLERVRNAPLGALLVSLREIHRSSGAEPGWLPAEDVLRSLPRGIGTPRERATRAVTFEGDTLSRVVDALRRIERAGDPRRALPTGRVPIPGDEPASYDSVRELFRSHERELRRRSLLVDRVLDQLRRTGDVDEIPAPAPLQQELRLVCSVGGATAGRFVVANETAAEREVRFDVGIAPHAAPAWAAHLEPAFTPEWLCVTPGDSRIVRVAVDLAGLPARPGERVELPVDVGGQGASLGRLWLEIVVAPAGEEGSG